MSVEVETLFSVERVLSTEFVADYVINNHILCSERRMHLGTGDAEKQ